MSTTTMLVDAMLECSEGKVAINNEPFTLRLPPKTLREIIGPRIYYYIWILQHRIQCQAAIERILRSLYTLSFFTKTTLPRSLFTFTAEGRFHGDAVWWWPDGTMRRSLNYRNGKAIGKGIELHPNGRVSRIVIFAPSLTKRVRYDPEGTVVGTFGDCDWLM